jgi:ankyrin repeat protein
VSKTPLVDAVYYEKYDKAIKMLNDGYRNVDEKCGYSIRHGEITAAHVAASRGHIDLLKLLIAKGCNVNAQDDRDGDTPLHYAALQHRLDCVKFLVNAGADVLVKDRNGKTPLKIADWNDYTDIVDYLKQRHLMKK